jgi:hypothetical protein
LVVNRNDATGGLIDTRTDTFGLRTVEIKDRHHCLNGERVRLTGMARHEESPWKGWRKLRERSSTTPMSCSNCTSPFQSLPSYPLHDYVAMWELRDRDGKLVQHGRQAFSDLERPQSVQADGSAQQDCPKDTLTVKILDLQGEVAVQMSMDAIKGDFGGEPVPEYK